MSAAETSALDAANARRHQAALVAARQAIAELQRAGSGVTFAAVAKSSGVARSWLYDQPEIRQLIARLRRTAPPPAANNDRASTESLRRMTEGLHLELGRLREENKALREQLARQLGLNRSHNNARALPGEDMSPPSSPGPTSTSS